MSTELEMTAPFSVVLTSCKRFHLLAPTIRSLLSTLDEFPEEFIIVEDSGDEGIRDVVAEFEPMLGRPFTVLVNAQQLGQMKSIERAYSAVNTPLIFHCEDDWEFTRAGYIHESRRLLRARPDVSMVGLRLRSDLNPRVRETVVTMLDDGDGPALGYMALDPKAHPEFFSYSFNPGLRRADDLRDIGPFSAFPDESDVSYAFKRRGFRMANLEQSAVRHLGGNEHVHDPTTPPKAKTPWTRMKRDIRKMIKRGKRVLNR